MVSQPAANARKQTTPNAKRHYEITRKDLPLHCPMDGMSLWNSHPRVFLAIEATGKIACPYCGATYTLVD
ncbi:MAG: zinc-finger domain-containing protein [Gammaproteobacteria bacterium]|nr:zinc-finger domain-containing protein [Gammaproteobacteria bacterium]MDE1887898.1 zinc-finger domain-containing protein [Gammaproteobacteria bacterium]MDE2024501.1 zinc-finger domain-containing protein [Gammaproteobacteria bacterium]MDE2139753.1 zinc-finger domain-containing protein [Gammaproteobacteria bacterium]MDE2273621.1 zinc-finger domain-containing protein [Gammaproteobacteria bacterium]